MCGRYHQAAPAERLGREFDLDIRDNFPARYNICPTQPISVIHMRERVRAYSLMRWGFIPSFAKKDLLDKLAVRPLINARADGVDQKPSFRHAFKRRRCLIPATGFYEWKAIAGAKQPYNIVCADGGEVLSFAGIWEMAHDPDGGEIETVAIVTTDAGADLRDLHSREPVVIRRDAYRFWLETDERDAAMMTSLLTAPKAGFWRAYAVSKAVNSAKNDGPDLVAPLAA